ncbi:hypothetical protein N7520_001076 [Penicillium odoratum]|uniref:uncharacterized protein n=1 Tax=Penicillium odoratum TaxID=1167516 RepID=UPI002548C45B|nr:uncharacterized protein N7520_001076 [Penicillium odoratum]KAJ5777830.1 hypothetical protein N7520_001076 [Penicillium odoratum]
MLSGYNAQTGDAWPWYSSNPCTSSNTNSDSVYVYTFDGAVTSQTGTFGIQGKGVSIRWQSTDFVSATSTSDASTSSTLTSAPTSAASVTASATSTTESVHNTTNTSTSNGLSTGAKIGIGIGCGVGAIILLIMAMVFYRKRKSKDASNLDQPMIQTQRSLKPVELYTNRHFAELESNSAPTELDATDHSERSM